ncbi:hypothetical protein CJ030_MR2G000643 [Morella rubra]|uniref:Uncharacterized protein n=1 Tax=Morella rubra TaxID=262757 RepID=A0A6A1WJP9_9ROSI|nr:hypothetical protein CJ030_MR2G023335 [Morella rubra]KAB1223922.1 hypothetical protein CJ030_MR2G000643 [Morella rubra]
MAVTSGKANPPNIGNPRLPPKRGRIKVGIISQFVKMIIRAASKAGRGMRRKNKGTEETPPPQGTRGYSSKDIDRKEQMIFS